MKKLLSILLSVSVCFSLCFMLTSCKSEEEKLLDNPTQEYVIKCLEKVPGILEIEAVTEDTDPMKNLNKPGWYTAHIYFSYQLINQEDVYGDDLIDKGTDAGGSVEVYKTKSDANKRNEYLSAFDGGVLSSVSHTVVGTCVVRTSNELTATQQKLLEKNISYALKGETDKIVNPITNGDNDDYSEASAIQYAKELANEYIADYPDDYFTPLYIRECLEDYGYTEEIALSAISKSNINWQTQADKYVNYYLTYTADFGFPASWITEEDLESSMIEDEFSSSIINNTLSKINWDLQAKKYVQHLSDFYDSWSRFDARYYLEDIFTESKIKYLLENSNIDWEEHALNKANELWLEYSEYEYDSISAILNDIREEMSSLWEYTNAEINYALNNIELN